VINEHIADVHRRLLRRSEFELICECGNCELVTIRVPEDVYEAARDYPYALLIDRDHVRDEEHDMVAHIATPPGVSVVTSREAESVAR
jgi:hypothetical protein